jgi:large repetitive protein
MSTLAIPNLNLGLVCPLSSISSTPLTATGGISPYTFSILTQSPNGNTVVSGTGTNQILTFTPYGPLAQTITVTYQVRDNVGSTATAALYITYQGPIAQPYNIITTQDTSITATVPVAIGGLGTIRYNKVSGGSHGTFTLSNNTTRIFTYAPNLGYLGSDTLIYRVNDNNNASATCTTNGTISVLVIPKTVTLNFSTCQDTILRNFLTSPNSVAPYNYVITNLPQNGKLGLLNSGTGDFTYTPNTGYFGTDSFTYSVTSSNPTITINGTVNITVNQNPIASNSCVSICIGHIFNSTLPITGGLPPYTVEIVTQPEDGKVMLYDNDNGNTNFTFTTKCKGDDSFQYKVHDANGCYSQVASINIKVKKHS